MSITTIYTTYVCVCVSVCGSEKSICYVINVMGIDNSGPGGCQGTAVVVEYSPSWRWWQHCLVLRLHRIHANLGATDSAIYRLYSTMSHTSSLTVNIT